VGLDQYLTARKFMSGADFWPEADRIKLGSVLNIMEANEIAEQEMPTAEVKVTALRWRKANQIHKWFVDNVQDGNDDCREHDVSRKQLLTLRNLCVDALAKRDPHLLPTQEGFFFGSTDIDEWYWTSIEHTHEGLKRLLENPALYTQGRGISEWSFSYQSSW
jgi:hypothetical protein